MTLILEVLRKHKPAFREAYAEGNFQHLGSLLALLPLRLASLGPEVSEDLSLEPAFQPQLVTQPTWATQRDWYELNCTK